MTFSWQVAILFVCVAAVAAAAYWIGYQRGVSSQKSAPEAEPVAALEALHLATLAPVPHIPPYRVRELTVLMELGVLTPEEFEHEKGKIHAGR